MPSHQQRVRWSTLSGRAAVLWALVAACLVWALLPTLSRSHLEGFTYFAETMSMMVPDLSAADPLWSVNGAFFHLSRPGVIWAMAPLSTIAPGEGYDILMWLAMPVFLSGLVLVARLWTGASWLACVAALLVLPLALEANYYANDNLVATGLALWAMVLLLGRRDLPGAVAAGMLYALAVLCRLDQVLVGPFIAILAIFHVSSLRRAAIRLGAVAAGFVLLHAAFALLDPRAANLLYRIALVAEADALWERGAGPLGLTFARDASAALLAFGVGLPAIAAGALALLHRTRSDLAVAQDRLAAWRSRGVPILLLGYPVFIYALTFGKYYDPRGFMTMLPMLAPLAALGLQRWVVGPLLAHGEAPVGHPFRTALVASLITLPFLVPGVPLLPRVLPLPAETENAVPTLTGRIWYTEAWRTWQTRGFHAPEARAAALVTALVQMDGPAIVVSTHWTDDRLLQNAMVVRGLVPVPVTLPDCGPVAEAWRGAAGDVIHHLRAHVPFIRPDSENTAALFLAHGAACLGSVPAARRIAFRPHGVFVSQDLATVALEPRHDAGFAMGDGDVERLRMLAADTLRRDGATDVDAAARTRFAEADRRLN